MAQTKVIYFVTGNADKFREFSDLVPNLKQLKLDLDEIQSLDPQIVVANKLEQASAHHNGSLIVEDTSLTAHCLRQLPGTLEKSFTDAIGVGGIAELVGKYDDHSATALTVIGYRDAKGASHFFTGELSGTIVPPRGQGWGWDCIFVPDGYNQTFGELGPEVKQRISHRHRAIGKFTHFLSTTAPTRP